MPRKRSELPSLSYTVDEKGEPIALSRGVGVLGRTSLKHAAELGAYILSIETRVDERNYVSWQELEEMAALEEAEKAAAAAAPPAGEGRAEAFRDRTDKEIVDQTEHMARIILADAIGTGYIEENPTPMRGSSNPRKQRAWAVACRIMEELTQTDPMDAASAIEGDDE